MSSFLSVLFCLKTILLLGIRSFEPVYPDLSPLSTIRQSDSLENDTRFAYNPSSEYLPFLHLGSCLINRLLLIQSEIAQNSTYLL